MRPRDIPPTTFFTNPVNGNSVDITVATPSATNNNGASYAMSTSQTADEYLGAYRLELWHEIYGLQRAIDVNENTPNTTINLNSIATGTYFLRLIIDGEIVNVSQMIIE